MYKVTDKNWSNFYNLWNQMRAEDIVDWHKTCRLLHDEKLVAKKCDTFNDGFWIQRVDEFRYHSDRIVDFWENKNNPQTGEL